MSADETTKLIKQAKDHYDSRAKSLDAIENDAFERLFEKFRIAVYTQSLHITRNEELAKECAQEVFTKAWEHIVDGKLLYPEKFHIWLAIVTRTTALQLMRSEKREAYKRGLLENLDYQQFLERMKRVQKDEELISWLIDPLTERDKKPIEAFLETGSVTDAAKILGCGQPQATKLLQRSVEKIKQSMKARMADKGKVS